MSSSHTQIACLTGCTLYFFITCCICLLYQTAKQPLFVRKSRTQVWSNKRPGASSRVKTKCKTWEILKIHFFSLPIHAPKLERFCAKIPCGCLEKKKMILRKKNPTVLQSTTLSMLKSIFNSANFYFPLFQLH